MFSTDMPQDFGERYSRQTMMPQIGAEGQRRLLNARVLVIGAGGLGSPLLLYLCAAGVGTLGICDPDKVSLSNLQRQVLYTTADLGEPKTAIAERRLKEINPNVSLNLYPEAFTAANAREIAKGYDLIADCCDNFTTRYLIDDVCAEAGIPWVHGAIQEMRGQLAVFNWRKGKRLTDIFPDRGYLCSLPTVTHGVAGPVPGAIGSLQACEVMKIITGCGTPCEGRLFTIDFDKLTTENIHF